MYANTLLAPDTTGDNLDYLNTILGDSEQAPVEGAEDIGETALGGVPIEVDTSQADTPQYLEVTRQDQT
jgi:hypothetical protein